MSAINFYFRVGIDLTNIGNSANKSHKAFMYIY